ncbi:MAG: outer membrane beta-barrel protein [Tannerella sp.]|jgi:hypothetical protein|nr:outer membrane beta-barrel protein [Tannerella sp.]
MKRKTMITVCCLAIWVGNIMAQDGKGSYALVSLNTGLSTLGFKVTGLDGVAGSVTSGVGIGVGIKYNYYFTSHWGIGTGIGLSVYNSSATLKGGMDDKNRYLLGPYMDDDNSGLPKAFELRARVENIKEKQNIQLFEIPLALQYQTRFSYGKWGAYGSLGVKFQLPIVKKFNVASHADGRLNVSGYYTDGSQNFDMGAPGTLPLPDHGFGTVDNPGKTLKWKGDTTLKTGMAGTLEAGVISRLNDESDFLIGAYLDYGFNDIKDSNIPLIEGPAESYHPAANDNIGKGIVYNGLLNTSLTDRIKPLSFGIKLGIRFKL